MITEQDAHARIASVLGGDFALTRRDDRWLALGAEQIAFAADDDEGWKRFGLEAWVAGRWRRGGVPAPLVLAADASLGVQVRERLHGLHGEGIASRIFAVPRTELTRFGERLATSYGELAARIRRAIREDEARAVALPLSTRRRLDLDAAIDRLRSYGASSATVKRASSARAWLEALPAADTVIHGDLHFFNLCCSDDGAITGVFDLGHTGLDAAATELLYVHSLGAQFVERALRAYGPIHEGDVLRAHVRTALDHLEWHPPGTPRHPAILSWIAEALERI